MTGVSSDIVPRSTVPFATNLSFDTELGLAQVRPGTNLIGSQLSAGNACLGVFNHRASTSSSHALIAAFNGSLFNVLTGSSMYTGLNSSAKVRFATFLDDTVAVNGTDSPLHWSGSGSFSTTGGNLNLSGIRAGTDVIIEWHDRLYAIGESSSPDRLSFTGTPSSGSVSWSATGSGTITIEQEDGGGTLTSLAKVPGYLLIFKQRSLKRWNGDSTFPDDLVNIGTQSHESVVYGRGNVFFFYGPKGFYRTNGGFPVRISRPIQYIVDAISSSYYENVSGWCDNEHVYWSIGDIDIDFGYGLVETHNNVVVRYTIDTDQWTVYKYAHEFRAWTQYISGSDVLIAAGDTDGQVLQINTGTSDYSGKSIFYILQSPELDFGMREKRKTISDRVIVHAYPAQGAELQVRLNYGKWEMIGRIGGLVSEVFIKPLTANVFEFRLVNASTGVAAKLRGLDFVAVDVHGSSL